MNKTKQNKFIDLGLCSQINHNESPKIFLCLSNSCKFTEALCQFCLINSHSNHRMISFKAFLKKTPQLFSENLKELLSLINSLKKQQGICNELEEICCNVKIFIKMIEEKINEKKKSIESGLSQGEQLYQEISTFNKVFFESFKLNKKNSNEKISDKINEIRKKLIIEGDSDIKLKNFSLFDDPFSEDRMNKILAITKDCNTSLTREFPQAILEKNQIPSSFNFSQITHNFLQIPQSFSQICKFELKKNYIIKNLIQLPNSIIVASGHDNSLRYFKFTYQSPSIPINFHQSLSIPINPHQSPLIKTIEGHNAWIRSLAFDGEFLASGSDDSTLKIWKLTADDTLEQVHLVHSSETNKAYYWSLVFIKKGVIAAGRGQNDNFSIRLWDFEGLEKQRALFGHRNIVRSLIVAHKEKALISVSDDASMKIWDLESFELKKTIYAHKKQINCIAFNKKLGLLATTGSDFLIKIWKIEGFYHCLRSIVCSAYEKVLVLGSFDKFGLLFSGSGNGVLRSWNWMDGSVKFTMSLGAEIHSILCNEDENLVFTGDATGKICVWYLY